MSCLLRVLLTMTVSHLFLMTLTIRKSTYQVFCRMSTNLGLYRIFLIVRLGLWAWGPKTIEVKCHSHYIVSRVTITAAVNLDHLAEAESVTFSILNLLPPFFPYCIVWKEITTHRPHLKDGDLGSPSLRGYYYLP